MFKKLCSLMVFSLVVTSNFLFSEIDRMDEAKEALISSHVEYSKVIIDRKRQKMKKQLKRLEESLDDYKRSAGNIDSEKILKSERKIKKLEKKIDTLKKMKIPLDIIDFKSL